MPGKKTKRSTEEQGRLDEAEAIILKGGRHRTVNAALRAVDMDRTTYTASIVHGLSDNPKTKTVEKLKLLGVLEIASRKTAGV